MSASQITGSASSYARKYALNGLFAIDDNKDADHESQYQNAPQKINEAQRTELMTLIQNTQTDAVKFCKNYAIKTVAELPIKEFERAKALLLAKLAKAK